MSSQPMLPSRGKHSVGTRIVLFEARFLARRCLCLRFTRCLTAPSARLEVKMVRYSFLVGLFHPRLHAGLSRRLRLLTRAARNRFTQICNILTGEIQCAAIGQPQDESSSLSAVQA